MNIKECKKEHLDGILDIENRSFKEPYGRKIFPSYMGSPLFLVAMNDDELVGYAMGTRSGVIVSIAVDPRHRRKGIGYALVEALSERISAKRLSLTVRVSNKGAYQFYKELGFKPRKKIIRYYDDGEDARQYFDDKNRR